ncbi:MAG: PAS domain S-box protein [Balneolaceae bacterium]|nr:MAG: PAS domain S-box protein [Balneolaceae bacterium]
MKPEKFEPVVDAHDFFENSGTGIIIIEEDGVISLANEEFARKTGYARHEIEGKIRWMELVHDDEVDRMMKLHRLRREKPEDVLASYNFRFKKKSGQIGEAMLTVAMIPGTRKSIVSIVDMTGRRKAEEAFRYQGALQQLLMDLAKGFINIIPDKVDAHLEEMLASIGSFTKMDRTYIFMHDHDRQTTSNTHEWCADGIAPEIDNLQDIPFRLLPDILKTHKKGSVFHVPDVLAMPENDSIRRILEPQGIRSVVLLPLQHEDTDLGFVGFDSVRQVRLFAETEIDLLKVAAEIISNALIRQQKVRIIQRNLDEKNILLAEIHHRVKNNLAIISSLLTLQSDFFSTAEETREVLEEMQHRIKSMALVHEMVYEQENPAQINFGELLVKLVSGFSKVYNDKVIDVAIQADDIMLDLNQTVPFSLLANELVVNACKHAFKDRKHGLIDVLFEKNTDRLRFVVKDNGVGVADSDVLENPKTLGYTIIRTLVAQLGGELDLKSDSEGFIAEGRFPLPG